MTHVTRASIAYIATQVTWIYIWVHRADCPIRNWQVRFALSSSPVFSRTDTVTDSERFYTTVLDLLEDVEETDEVNKLITWWNR
jgi:hypothetical protein